MKTPLAAVLATMFGLAPVAHAQTTTTTVTAASTETTSTSAPNRSVFGETDAATAAGIGAGVLVLGLVIAGGDDSSGTTTTTGTR